MNILKPDLPEFDFPPLVSESLQIPTKKNLPKPTIKDLKECTNKVDYQSCPLPLFFGLLFFGFLLIVFFIWRIPAIDDNKVAHPFQQKVLAVVVAVITYLIIGGLFFYWLRFSCNDCSGASPFSILGISVFGALNTYMFTSFVLSYVLDVDHLIG